MRSGSRRYEEKASSAFLKKSAQKIFINCGPWRCRCQRPQLVKIFARYFLKSATFLPCHFYFIFNEFRDFVPGWRRVEFPVWRQQWVELRY